MSSIGIEFTTDMVSTTLAYVGAVFNDLNLVILLIVGVSLGLIVVAAIINALRH